MSMKIEVIETPCPQRLPEVGQFWMLAGFPKCVYLRVADSIGRKALNHEDVAAYKDYFYSLPSSGSYICATSCQAHGIQLLQPVGGTLKLEVVP